MNVSNVLSDFYMLDSKFRNGYDDHVFNVYIFSVSILGRSGRNHFFKNHARVISIRVVYEMILV